jgi:signal transduction histidine kinase
LPKLSRTWWTPLAFVVVALVALLVTPFVVDRRVTEMRDRLENGSERGRLLINDLEAAFASQLLAGPAESPSDTTAIATEAHLASDETELRETMARVGPEASAKFGELHGLIRVWSESHRTGTRDSTTRAEAREIFLVAENLDNYLATVSEDSRQAARRVERWTVISAAILAPIALIAVILVIWSGRRLVAFADAAEERRVEAMRAAEARAALMRGVTHDVKNPLGAAAGYAQLLEEGIVGDLTQAQRDMLARIRRLVEQSVDTVTDLLELARADSGGLQVEYSRADLSVVASQVVDDLRGSAAENHIALDFAGDATPVITDPKRVRQVLANLVSNAVKYTPDGGKVHVSIVHDGRGGTTPRVGVRVQDDGPGIPAELRDRLFEEFFRVSRDEKDARGNGLGLAISRRIAHLLGGDVTFQPVEPHGAVFTLWLDGHVG